MRIDKLFLAIGAIAALVVMPARADPGPIVSWLMDEPLLLWDIGMVRAQRTADLAARRVGKWVADNHQGGFVEADVIYHWDNNELVFDVWVYGVLVRPKDSECSDIRYRFLRNITRYPKENQGD